MIDYIIIGQGIAGTLLSWFLKKEGKSFLIIDQFNPSSSSHVAAGIIHPVTGRRIVKTWRADEFIPFAKQTYRDIENQFGEKLFFEKEIIEIFSSQKHRNDWQLRSSDEGMKEYIGNELPDGFDTELDCPFGAITVNKGGYLDLSKLISLWRNELEKNNWLLNDWFEENKLVLNEDHVSYKEVKAKAIIYCDGYNAATSKYFSSLPFILSKGETLTIRCQNLTEKYIINRGIYILPVGNHIFKVGATNEWDQLNEAPTSEGKEKLESLLKKIIKSGYTVLDHKAAVRPTVKDRRPFLGAHPLYKNLFIFNGLGTKGVTLAPSLANHFVDYLEGKTELNKEVSIAKFYLNACRSVKTILENI